MPQKKNGHRRKAFAHSLQALVHVSALFPLILLLRDYLTGQLGFNPVEAVTQRTGRIAVTLLLLSLSCTPFRHIFGLAMIGRLRKPLGLYAALYAGIHFMIFALWDYGMDFNLIWTQIIEKPFIIIGAVALLILLILTITSFKRIQTRIGKAWKQLHWLVYPAAGLIILHYLLAIKGDLFSLQGAYTAPLIAGGILLILLILRIRPVYQSLRRLFIQREPTPHQSERNT